MTSLSTIRALRERVAAATGPDRELDADLCVVLQYVGNFDGVSDVTRVKGKGWMLTYSIDGRTGYSRVSPGITASVDAVLALIRRTFPHACITINEWEEHAELGFSLMRHEMDLATAGGEGKTTALAGCAALLAAKEGGMSA